MPAAPARLAAASQLAPAVSDRSHRLLQHPPAGLPEPRVVAVVVAPTPTEAKVESFRRTSVCPLGQVTPPSTSPIGRRTSNDVWHSRHRYSYRAIARYYVVPGGPGPHHRPCRRHPQSQYQHSSCLNLLHYCGRHARYGPLNLHHRASPGSGGSNLLRAWSAPDGRSWSRTTEPSGAGDTLWSSRNPAARNVTGAAGLPLTEVRGDCSVTLGIR